ncbi:MAG: energy-coupling factor transporter ATPase [Clostridiales bacterium]|jgi:energy-coupling factor transport system ATP-binding protein|nr:energy-coupling factor transporter ATPase [Clostridiales bacterium]
MDIIRTESLIYKYIAYNEDSDAPVPVVPTLNGIDLNVEQGRFTAILGRNGSGKSTFAKHINALLTPTEGAVWVKGIDTRESARIWDVRQSVGMVFQNPDNQIIATIVEEDVAFGPENLGVPSERIRDRVDEAIAAVGMEEYRRSAPHHLSGGQKQRVAIAGVLAMKPSCIVLDEPTAMLDPAGRREVMDTVIRLNKTEGISVILITHFMEEAVRADRVIVMDHGQIAVDGSPREVFKQVSALKNLGLDVPQAAELAYMLNKKANRAVLPDGLLTMDELAKALTAVSKSAEKASYVLTRSRAPADKHSKTILEIKDLSFIYNQGSIFEKKALDSVSLSITPGEFIGLIGHTGSGKSTLIQHFNALLTPTFGQVLFNGADMRADKSRLKSIRQRVGLVFQYPEHQLFEMTVLKDVSFGPENMGLPQDEVKERAEKALAAVGMEPAFFDKSPFELSGGQKRRVAIAGVLAMRPEVLILDEPTAGLDPKGRDEILERIRFMHSELRLTVILVSHSMEDVAKLAERVIVINHGRIAFDGEPSEVFGHVNELESMGLAAPQPVYLMRALKRAGWDVPERIFSLTDAAAVLTSCLIHRRNEDFYDK